MNTALRVFDMTSDEWLQFNLGFFYINLDIFTVQLFHK